MEMRFARLAKAADCSAQWHSQALLTEARLSTFRDSHAAKSKSMLLGLADGKDRAFLNGVFVAWCTIGAQLKHGTQLHRKLQTELQALEAELVRCKQAKLTNVRNVLLRHGQDGDLTLIQLCVATWANETARRKAEGDTAVGLRSAEQRFKLAGHKRKEATKNLLSKMVVDNHSGSAVVALQGWLSYMAEVRKEKETQAAVQRVEASLKVHLAKKKDKAKVVLDRMAGSSDSGLLAQALSYWLDGIAKEKAEAAGRERSDRLKSLAIRQLGTATRVQMRVNDQMSFILILQCVWAWVTRTKVKKMERRFDGKISGKRKQLNGIQTLFTRFAQQLDEGLGTIEEENTSSARGQGRKVAGPRSHSTSNVRAGRDVHLPDIHARHPVLT
mmetsp:Transcript_16429/g.37881  ORF Transcript_16429/g.37881 Transcript_16429/m.37881 type:complete len:386 (-) Transcript_16429:188-1345(-)